MKINKSFYVILNKENEYYNEFHDLFFKDILEATQYDKLDKVKVISEELNCYSEHTRIASVQLSMEITLQE